ncbi:uncharacterized protein DNG_00271 [Cephalotrichum gorgonifer]|uniref:EKC/KEOPS complex subunit BUD32 n=1 Tax=Cephalotrichum gorgonifer TaxID=2041049 RepID=A0AAE8SQQ5_9PEZI|nr:uncharacterized protein DNG_00271 [Cephalotrichum gorgonifer]
MSLNSIAIHDVVHPTAAFVEETSYPSTAFAGGDASSDKRIQTGWESSPLNPKNRINSLDFPKDPLWRIDGCAGLGTQFYAVPLFMLPAMPARVDVFIPEQTTQTPEVRALLQLDDAFHIKDRARVSNLAITRLITRKLQEWTLSIPDLKGWYNSLPFGSRIVFENLALNTDNIRVRVARLHNLERQLKSSAYLSKEWGDSVKIPPEIALSGLEIVEQVHDSVCVVRIEGREWILKALTSYPKYLYLELRHLLTIKPHRNIVSRPVRLVTKRCSFGSKNAVVGFLLEYHRPGTLRDILPFRQAHRALPLEDQLRWSLQITSALLHLHEICDIFYPDLRLDNVVLSKAGDAIMVDFEQRGVWCEFSAPEVNFIEYMLLIASSDEIPDPIREHFQKRVNKLLRGYDDIREFTRSQEHLKNLPSYNIPWLCLSRKEHEAAEVYMLGRVLWSIFEGVSAPHQSAVWQSYKWESDLEFPAFRRTPTKLRDLIDRCTRGRRHTLSERVSRVGSKLVLTPSPDVLDDSGDNISEDGVPDGSDEMKIYQAGKKWWMDEVAHAEAFLDEREELLSRGQWTDNPFNRPSLSAVLAELDEFRKEIGIPDIKQ